VAVLYASTNSTLALSRSVRTRFLTAEGMARRFGTGSDMAHLFCDTWDDEASHFPSITEFGMTRVPPGVDTVGSSHCWE
jgi:hypothetical protein